MNILKESNDKEEKIPKVVNRNCDLQSPDFWLSELDVKKLQEKSKSEHELQDTKLEQMFNVNKKLEQPQ